MSPVLRPFVSVLAAALGPELYKYQNQPPTYVILMEKGNESFSQTLIFKNPRSLLSGGENHTYVKVRFFLFKRIHI